MTEYKTLKELNVQPGDVVGNRYNIYVYDVEFAGESAHPSAVYYTSQTLVAFCRNNTGHQNVESSAPNWYIVSCTSDENAWTSTYKPGIWYGWNGGECPVHPEDELEIVDAHGVSAHGRAGGFNWNELRGAFMIIPPYVEPRKPREIWVNEYPESLDDMTFTTKAEAWAHADDGCIRTIKFIEAVEG